MKLATRSERSPAEATGALLIVDVQNDFCPGGSLPVPAGDEVVPVLNGYIERFVDFGLPVYATRDWHPPRTRHFRTHGGPWPPHCVRTTVLAAAKADFEAFVLTDAIRGIDAEPGAVDRACAAMEAAGARFAVLEDVDREIREFTDRDAAW